MFEPCTIASVLKIVTTAAGTEIRYDDTWPVTCSHWGCAKSM